MILGMSPHGFSGKVVVVVVGELRLRQQPRVYRVLTSDYFWKSFFFYDMYIFLRHNIIRRTSPPAYTYIHIYIYIYRYREFGTQTPFFYSCVRTRLLTARNETTTVKNVIYLENRDRLRLWRYDERLRLVRMAAGRAQ